MPVIFTDTPRLSNWLKFEFEPALGYTREAITLNDAAGGTYKNGTVLGKITATSKYQVSKTAAGDGSQTPAGVLFADGLGLSSDMVLSAGVDTPALMLARGPALVSDVGLVYGTGHTAASVKTAFAALNPPIQVVTGL